MKREPVYRITTNGWDLRRDIHFRNGPDGSIGRYHGEQGALIVFSEERRESGSVKRVRLRVAIK